MAYGQLNNPDNGKIHFIIISSCSRMCNPLASVNKCTTYWTFRCVCTRDTHFFKLLKESFRLLFKHLAPGVNRCGYQLNPYKEHLAEVVWLQNFSYVSSYSILFIPFLLRWFASWGSANSRASVPALWGLTLMCYYGFYCHNKVIHHNTARILATLTAQSKWEIGRVFRSLKKMGKKKISKLFSECNWHSTAL